MSEIDKNEANFKRRVHTQFFSDQNLREVENRLGDLINEFLGLFRNKQDSHEEQVCGDWGATVNMAEACNLLTFDVITDLSYGQAMGLMKSSNNNWILEAVRAMSWRGMMVLITSIRLRSLSY